MTKSAQKNMLLAQLNENGANIDIIGWITWWSIRNVSLTLEQFEQRLEQAGFDKKYAKLHNYRCACIRALRSMEEDRIIRFVGETDKTLTYQFTAEHRVESAEGATLEYEKETLVAINKETYQQTSNFREAVSCRDDIKKTLVELFEQYKKLYKSSDLTRYLQKILAKEADIVSLRPQGSVYFVPAGYKDVLDKLKVLTQSIAGIMLELVPIPAVDASKKMVHNALTSELDNEFSKIEAEIEAAMEKGDDELTKVWCQTRINRVRKLLRRVDEYASVILNTNECDKWTANAKRLEDKIFGIRQLDLE